MYYVFFYVKISFDAICRLGSPKCYLARSLMDLPLRRSTNPMLMTKPRMDNTYNFANLFGSDIDSSVLPF